MGEAGSPTFAEVGLSFALPSPPPHYAGTMDISTLIVAGMGFIGIIVTQILTTRRESKRHSAEAKASRDSFLLAQRVDAYSNLVASLSSSIQEKRRTMVEERFRNPLPNLGEEFRLPTNEATLNRHRELDASLYQAYARVCVVGGGNTVESAIKLMNAFNASQENFFEWLAEVNKLSAKFTAEAYFDVQGTNRGTVDGTMFENPTG